MEHHQYAILEKLFYKKKCLAHVYQRIGDRNQAIYTSKAFKETLWLLNRKNLKLSTSKRLTEFVAKVVQPFSLTPLPIIGANNITNPLKLKPIIIIYDDSSIQNVIKWFSKIILAYQSLNIIPFTDRKYYAIGWRKEHENPNCITLKSYFPNFESYPINSSEIYDSLYNYIVNSNIEQKSFNFIRKNILNSIIHVLRIENIYFDSNLFFTGIRLLKFLKEKHPVDFQLLLQKLFIWSLNLAKGNFDSTYEEMKNFIITFLNNDFNIQRISADTLNFLTQRNHQTQTSDCLHNCYNIDGVSIQIGTVHSVKGTTNCATLYMETFYEGMYESDRMIEQLKCIAFNDQRIRNIQTAKIMYVGFSRPTHLLCFAAHGKRIQSSL